MSQITKSTTSLYEYGSQQRLGVFANAQKNLNPTAELLLAKDYNQKVNQSTKSSKPVPPPSTYDENTKSTLKDNLERINNLYKNNPTFKSSDPIVQNNYPVDNKSHVRKTPLSDVDNFKNINNNPSTSWVNPNSKFNYETKQNDWKPSSKTIQANTSSTRENFEKRELKKPEIQPVVRNPIIEEKVESKYGKHITFGKVFIYYEEVDNTESKKLLANDYGKELKYKEDKGMANKCTSYTQQERTFLYSDTNNSYFGKKQSEFEQKNAFLRGK